MGLMSMNKRLTVLLVTVGACSVFLLYHFQVQTNRGRARSVDQLSRVHLNSAATDKDIQFLHTKHLQLTETPLTVNEEVSDFNPIHTSAKLFQLRSSFQLPVPHCTLSVDSLLQQPWIRELQEILSTIDPLSGPISLTTSDYNFRDVLLNWLSASTVHITPQLSHILILCMDKSLYDLLKAHNITSIYAPPESFINKKTHAGLDKHIAFTRTQILRLTVMRLLNHWGYDAANYDADAILVKNTEPLMYDIYRESSLIASYGRFPAEIRVQWGGTTLCAGMFMVKSGPATEIFWKMMNAVVPNSYNDQARLNNALLQLGVRWDDNHHGNIQTTDWQGATDTGFNVTVLSALRVCRQTCNSKAHKKEYYVWHRGGSGKAGKMHYARQGGLWYLKKDWETVTNHSTLTGIDWLRAISVV